MKRVVVEKPRVDSDLRLLHCSGQEHRADAQKSYKELRFPMSSVSEQKCYPNEDKGGKIVKDGDEEITANEDNHRHVGCEYRYRGAGDIGRYRRGELQCRTDVNSCRAVIPMTTSVKGHKIRYASELSFKKNP